MTQPTDATLPDPDHDEPVAPGPDADGVSSGEDAVPSSPTEDEETDAMAWGLLDVSLRPDVQPDGVPMSSAAPRTGLRKGDMVALVLVLDPAPASGPNAERIWVETDVVERDGSYQGRLTSEPSLVAALRASALIVFEPRHVAGVALWQEDNTFELMLRAVVSAQALVFPGPPARAGRDEPVTRDDSGWSITTGDDGEGPSDASQPDGLRAVTLGELVGRFPALLAVFQAGEGEWEYRADRRGYVRLDQT